MFKGLRTKIESEQQGQVPKSPASHQTSQESIPAQPPPPKETSTIEAKSSTIGTAISRVDLESNKREKEDTNQQKQQQGNNRCSPNHPSGIDIIQDERLHQTVTDLKKEISLLNDQLKSVIKERDESNDQNAQLYQLIEKLRRNLESEKETAASLQTRLNEAEKNLREQGQKLNSSSSGISVKSFVVKETHADPDQPETIEALHGRLSELQNLLTEKTRQLKIRNQNMNDLKKALQREVIEHGKTQDELAKLQNQVKQQLNQNQNDGASRQNSYSTIINNDKDTTSELSLDISHNSETVQATNPLDTAATGTMPNDKYEQTTTNRQLDMMSHLSKSSASVDDFDSHNDLHNNKQEVNHEYLRNVLFRYMTSTDTETSQHLVKAISVMMNFTPEQSAAIKKSAIHSRSSWLRLK